MISVLFLAMSDYITRYFDEKDLDDQVYEVESPNGTVNFISTGDVIWALKTSEGDARRSIQRVLHQLDLCNGDVHHFLKHMAKGLALSIPM
tara:strand:+ start:825 stop:1097 length:273 start_codon:yes stop_codon:yes gene_type:complete